MAKWLLMHYAPPNPSVVLLNTRHITAIGQCGADTIRVVWHDDDYAIFLGTMDGVLQALVSPERVAEVLHRAAAAAGEETGDGP